MTAAVHLKDVRVTIGGRLVLDVPSLTIGSGERVALVGPNGAGKSTLLKLIGGLVEAQRGEVQVLGRCVTGPVEGRGRALRSRLGPRERRSLRLEIGLLMQELHLVPRLTASENVLIGALGRLNGADALRSLLRWYPAELVARADAALHELGLADRACTRADRLSGGERQQVALARLQLQRPRLVLADEPTSALDPAATRQVCTALTATVAGPGHTLVTVVHDVELLPHLATRVIGMTAGRVRWDLPIGGVTPPLLRALYARQADPAGDTDKVPPIPMTRLARA